MTARAAVVGAGPSGFYAADQLLKAGVAVDLFDALPTPFGLVRAGVAPDHPKIKSVTRMYEKTAQHPAFRFFGGVEVGVDVTPEDLLDRYHAVVYAVGTPTDNRLGVPGDGPRRLGRRHRVRRLVQRPPAARRRGVRPVVRARRRGRQRERRDRRRPNAGARSRRARGDRHRRPCDRGVRRRVDNGSGHPRPPRARAGGVHEPGAARARRAGARRRGRRPGRARARSGQRRVARVRRRLPHGPPEHRHPARASRPADRPGGRTASSCASAARRSRSSATGRRAGDRAAGRAQPARAGSARRRSGGGDRRAGGHPLRARDPLDRPPRPSAPGRPVRRAPWADPQRGRPGVRGGRHAARGRVRRRLDQARTVRRHRHEQEVRRRHRRGAARRPRARPAADPPAGDGDADRAVAADRGSRGWSPGAAGRRSTSTSAPAELRRAAPASSSSAFPRCSPWPSTSASRRKRRQREGLDRRAVECDTESTSVQSPTRRERNLGHDHSRSPPYGSRRHSCVHGAPRARGPCQPLGARRFGADGLAQPLADAADSHAW